MRLSWIIAALAKAADVDAARIAFTLPDLGAEHLSEEDWYDL